MSSAAVDILDPYEIFRDRLQDRDWRMDNLYFIRDKQGERIKFVRNESQLKMWDNMWHFNIILKDRQRGFSTLIALYILDICLFNAGTQAGIIDITLDDAKLKLDKIRFAYNNLPEELKVICPRTEDKKESIAWLNGSAVRVGTSHRGGTLQILHISEMGKIAARFPDRAREIRTGALNTLSPGQMIFMESTAEGNAGDFYDYCQSARTLYDSKRRLSKLDWRFHFFGWTEGTENEMSPDGVYISHDDEKYFDGLEQELGREISDRKRSWYVKKSVQQGDDMQREYPGTPDEAFAASIQGAYLQKTLTTMRKKGQIDRVPIDPQYPLNTGWDYGLSDSMTIWVHQRVKFEDRLVGYHAGEDDDILYYWKMLQERYDNLWGTHFLPHDFAARRGGTAKDPGSPPRTLEDIFREAGMRNTRVVPVIGDKRAGIAEVRSWLPKVIIDEPNCAEGLKCLMNFRREWDDIMGCWKERPRHDWAMHGYDGLESLVRGLNAYGVRGVTIEDKERDGLVTRKRPAPDWRYH